VIRHHVKQNSGNEQDAQDVFQDTLVALFNQVRAEPFKLACSLKTYVTSIGKNLWLQRLDYKFRLLYQADLEVNEPGSCYTIEDQFPEYESLVLQRLLYKNIMLLPDDCRRLLQLYCLKVPFREIARMMKFKDEVYVKTRKYTCKNLLRKKMIKDPECLQFLEI
jgi:RNA polymerase sigma factor (sigma-70 family)